MAPIHANRLTRFSSRRQRKLRARPSRKQSGRLSTILCICVFFYICTLSRTSSLRGLEEESKQPTEVKCFAYSECDLCPKTGDREACDETNRRQTFHCHVSGKKGSTATYSEYRSCQRTVTDESHRLVSSTL